VLRAVQQRSKKLSGAIPEPVSEVAHV
jgi:hypothetical protein